MTQLAFTARPARRAIVMIALAGALVSTLAPLVRPSVAIAAPHAEIAAVA